MLPAVATPAVTATPAPSGTVSARAGQTDRQSFGDRLDFACEPSERHARTPHASEPAAGGTGSLDQDKVAGGGRSAGEKSGDGRTSGDSRSRQAGKWWTSATVVPSEPAPAAVSPGDTPVGEASDDAPADLAAGLAPEPDDADAAAGVETIPVVVDAAVAMPDPVDDVVMGASPTPDAEPASDGIGADAGTAAAVEDRISNRPRHTTRGAEQAREHEIGARVHSSSSMRVEANEAPHDGAPADSPDATQADEWKESSPASTRPAPAPAAPATQMPARHRAEGAGAAAPSVIPDGPQEAPGSPLPIGEAARSGEVPAAAVAASGTAPAQKKAVEAGERATASNDTAAGTAPAPAVAEGVAAAAQTSGGEASSSDGHDAPARQGGGPQLPVGRLTGAMAGLVLTQAADGTLALTMPVLSEAVTAALRPAPENVDALIQTMRVMVKDGVSEATVRLRPDNLGEVSISIKVDGKSVTATVLAESAGVREWLQSQEESLRSGLLQKGLTLDRLHVQRDPARERREQPPQQQDTRRQRWRMANQLPPRFEISV